jgi:hypothetical protein
MSAIQYMFSWGTNTPFVLSRLEGIDELYDQEQYPRYKWGPAGFTEKDGVTIAKEFDLARMDPRHFNGSMLSERMDGRRGYFEVGER